MKWSTRTTKYLVPASNIQLQFERRLIEENIPFLREDTYYKQPYIKYMFEEKDADIANQILAELKGEVYIKEGFEEVDEKSEALGKRLIVVFIIFITLILIFWFIYKDKL